MTTAFFAIAALDDIQHGICLLVGRIRLTAFTLLAIILIPFQHACLYFSLLEFPYLQTV